MRMMSAGTKIFLIAHAHLQNGVIKCHKGASRYQSFSEYVLVCSEVLSADPSTNMIVAPFSYWNVVHFERCCSTLDILWQHRIETTIKNNG